ncbi:putative DNA replication complex GINS protein SLD5 [Hibiscus syriacus]|uniref:DNA replication complex GINS protein SLD5 n=1 Tax=Hibiscus syriacus TaxID=106335 RepID=A0A6A3A4Q7_HIBSY|nr:calcium-binding protein CP1-like [Hibiscus syriacus]KAE8698222.1 putative DNA replication complex GINS protein SLD5 [Hibiscus syriacus]
MCPSERNWNRPENGVPATDFRSAFEILDADRDGKISREDLKRFSAGFSNGFNDDDEMIGAMISLADLNKDGFVEYEEFERVLGGHKKKVSSGYGVMEDVFKVMDKDGDGRLSHEDLKSYMDWAGFPASDEDITGMIKLAGGGDSGEGENGVTFDGLLKILAVDFSG